MFHMVDFGIDIDPWNVEWDLGFVSFIYSFLEMRKRVANAYMHPFNVS